MMSYTAYIALALGLWAALRCVYNVYFHPLRATPGPFLASISRWWLFSLEMGANPHLELLALHRKHGM